MILKIIFLAYILGTLTLSIYQIIEAPILEGAPIIAILLSILLFLVSVGAVTLIILAIPFLIYFIIIRSKKVQINIKRLLMVVMVVFCTVSLFFSPSFIVKRSLRHIENKNL
jgi:hypothetical protein